ncbi:hypothetical protein DSM104299_00981 [Baekduia alba]|nr:hypothetical protein DSM104299_00981 [Baekduia alba]
MSPTTGKRYDVSCAASASTVECTAGTNAYIKFPSASAAEVAPPAAQAPARSVAPPARPSITDQESPNMDDNSNAILALAIVAGVLVWVVPSILVAAHASRNGFRFGSFLVVALFLSWPLALFGDVLFGARSPLVRQRVTVSEPQEAPTLVTS